MQLRTNLEIKKESMECKDTHIQYLTSGEREGTRGALKGDARIDPSDWSQFTNRKTSDFLEEVSEGWDRVSIIAIRTKSGVKYIMKYGYVAIWLYK